MEKQENENNEKIKRVINKYKKDQNKEKKQK
jgi:hypothetical protein